MMFADRTIPSRLRTAISPGKAFFHPVATAGEVSGVEVKEHTGANGKMLQQSQIVKQHGSESPTHAMLKTAAQTFFGSGSDQPYHTHRSFRHPVYGVAPGRVQCKKETAKESERSVQLESYTNSLQGNGHSLSDNSRRYYEPKFGYDFSNVKIHNNAQAHRSCEGINALAYSYRNHIVFGEGQYQPASRDGNRILAHELAHVVQQQTKNLHQVQRLVRKSRVSGCKDESENPVSELVSAEQVAFTFLQKAIKKIQAAEEEYAEAVHKHITPNLNELKNYKNAFEVARHLRTAFGFSPVETETWDKLRIIRVRFMKTISYLDSVVFDYNCCKAGEDCPKSGGHKCPEKRIAFTRAEDNPTLIVLCPGFWGSPDSKGLTLAHEVMHLWSKGFLKDTTTEVFGIKKETPKFLDVYRYENFLRLLNT